jgi:hypothetical protein
MNDVAKRERDEAMDRVARGAGMQWNRDAYESLVGVARRKELFTSEDCRDELRARGHSDAREPRAWGPVMMRAVRAGIIERTPMTTAYRSRSRHAAPNQRVWRSLIYGRMAI